jgi:hypothetical protein
MSPGIADGGFDERVPSTPFMMRPSVLYVATVSDFLSSSRTPSYGLERGCRDAIFHSFVKANFQIRVFRIITDCEGRRMDFLQMDLASTLLPVTRFCVRNSRFPISVLVLRLRSLRRVKFFRSIERRRTIKAYRLVRHAEANILSSARPTMRP